MVIAEMRWIVYSLPLYKNLDSTNEAKLCGNCITFTDRLIEND